MQGLAVNRMSRGLEHQLVETKIQPCAKFECGVPDRSSMHKSKLFVQGNTGRVGDVDAANHDVILLFFSRFNQLSHERYANAFAAMVLVYVDRMFH